MKSQMTIKMITINQENDRNICAKLQWQPIQYLLRHFIQKQKCEPHRSGDQHFSGTYPLSTNVQNSMTSHRTVVEIFQSGTKAGIAQQSDITIPRTILAWLKIDYVLGMVLGPDIKNYSTVIGSHLHFLDLVHML